MDEDIPYFSAVRVVDPEMLLAAIRGARLHACQLSPRAAPSMLARLVCRRLCLDFAALGPAMHFNGVMPGDRYTLAFVMTCPQNGHSFNFASEHTDGYIGFFPPGGVLDATTPVGYASATITVPKAEFHAALARFFPEIPDQVLNHGAGMRVGTIEQAILRNLLGRVETAIHDPQAPLAAEPIRQVLERDLLAAFLMALRSGCENLVPSPTQRVTRRYRRLNQAVEFIAENGSRAIHLGDLCAELELSERGVENLFRDLLGIAPNAYLRQHKLHLARRTLRQAAPASGTIKQTAMELGFGHLGRFARDYRSLFGVGPSETLFHASRSCRP